MGGIHIVAIFVVMTLWVVVGLSVDWLVHILVVAVMSVVVLRVIWEIVVVDIFNVVLNVVVDGVMSMRILLEVVSSGDWGMSSVALLVDLWALVGEDVVGGSSVHH
jgi:hypothetical protein